MVEQIHPGNPGTSRRPGAPVTTLTAEARDTRFRGRLLLLFVACLFIPGIFSVAGSQLSPYRIVLLAVFPWLLWRWLTARPCLVDFLVLASAVWTVLALVMNHGQGVGPRAVISFVEYFGGYLVGRILITDAREYKRYFVILAVAFAVLLPFVLLEMATASIPSARSSARSSRSRHASTTSGSASAWSGRRERSSTRSSGGSVATLGVANGFYIWRRTS